MNTLSTFLKHLLSNHHKWDFRIFSGLTLLSVLNGQTTVFYLIYFFWWNELIRILVDSFFYKRNLNAVLISDNRESVFGSFIPMSIYFVFIVVFFGIIANWKNSELTLTNMGILFFQNWFFNVNLIFVTAERIFLHKTHQPLQVSFGSFTPNMIVLHISIILGGIMMFFVVHNFPDIFTPENLWGSVIIALPFLLLKKVIPYLSAEDSNNNQHK